jgi:uncharacterized protein (DUF4415 family)
MNAKLPNTKADWVDPDDAPELTGDELEHPRGVWMDGDKPISREEGKAYFREMLGKKQVSMLLDVAVIEYFKAKASGHGYQTLINETLKQAIERETLEETLRRVLREELAQHSKVG